MTGADEILVEPPNTLPRIESVWMFLSVDEAGREGVCAAPLGARFPIVPLISADPAGLDQLRPLARAVAAITGRKIVVARFTGRVDEEVIAP